MSNWDSRHFHGHVQKTTGRALLQVQQTAAASVKWSANRGAVIAEDDLVYRIARTGACGKYENNCERDMHTLLSTFRKRLGVKVSSVLARTYDHATASIQWSEIAVIYPDDLATALYEKGPKVWRHTMVGGQGDDEIQQFWDHCAEHCDWFRGSHCYNYPLRSRIIPLSLYGDDIAAYRNTEGGSVTVLGWCSDLGFANKPSLRYFPLAVYPEYSATQWTHDDIMASVVDRILDMTDPEVVHSWSSDGWVFIASSLQGDLKFIRDTYRLHNFQKNAFCSACGCVKKADNLSMTLGDFRPDAAHASTAPDLSDFMESRSVVFRLGLPLDRVLHDCLHSQLLATGKALNGSAIIYLAERGVWGRLLGRYDEGLAVVLKAAHKDFLEWKKGHGLQASQPRFTPARLSRRTRMQYPSLSSKGIPSKVVSFWISDRALQHAEKEGATDLDRMVATCVHSYSATLKIMDTAGVLLTSAEADAYYDAGMTHLLTYAHLHALSRGAKKKEVNRTSWLLLCKHHHYYHHLKQVKEERLNPRITQLLAAEDWVGKMGRIARACHKSNVSRRTLERHLATLYLELQKL